MSNKLLILHYSDDASVYEALQPTASSPESLRLLLEEFGYKVRGGVWSLNLERPDIHFGEVLFDPEHAILFLDFLNDVEVYAALCRWVRAQVPEHLPVHFLCDSGHPFFELDFDNLEEQILAEVPMP